MNSSMDLSETMLSQISSQQLTNFEIKSNNSSKRNQFKFQRPSLNFNLVSSLKKLKNFDSFTQTPKANTSQLTANEDEMLGIFAQKYKQLEELGKGCHSRVSKVQKFSNNKMYAAKIIQIENEETKIEVEKEFNLLRRLKYQYIIKPKELIYDECLESYIIIQELFEGQTLNTIFNDELRQKRFSNNDIILILKQLLETIEFLHEQNIVHRDITVYNVLYDENKKEIKLIDFGISKNFKRNDEEFMISPRCNEIFAPPECLDQSNMFCKEKMDEFQCGLILLSLLENQTIVSSKLGKILKSHQQNYTEDNLYNLCIKLLRKNPENRISASEALLMLKIIEQKNQF